MDDMDVVQLKRIKYRMNKGTNERKIYYNMELGLLFYIQKAPMISIFFFFHCVVIRNIVFIFYLLNMNINVLIHRFSSFYLQKFNLSQIIMIQVIEIILHQMNRYKHI